MSLRPLYSAVQDAKKLSREEFLRKWSYPVLVVEPFEELETERFETVLADDESASGGVARVAPLQKRPGSNTFRQMITIGRAKNNDICLQSEGISKFHAYVMLPPGRPPTLTDAGSTNGTSVRGEALEPRERVELRAGDELKLGTLSISFHTPESLLEHALGISAAGRAS